MGFTRPVAVRGIHDARGERERTYRDSYFLVKHFCSPESVSATQLL
jgi:hypothetical protein